MRRKSERNKAKPAEKKPEPSPKKSRRSSRRRKRSTSRSSSEDSDDAPLKSAAPEVVVAEVTAPAEEPKKSSSHSNSDEDKDEQPIWKVKTSDVSSGEIQKLKICLQRPSTTPERTEKSPRRRRGKTSSQSDEASLTPDEKVHNKRKTRNTNSPSVNTSEGSSLDNSVIEAAEKDENIIVIKETNEVIIGKGKLDSSQTKQDSENETYVQDSQIEENEKESHNNTNESNNDNDQCTVKKQTNEQCANKQTDEDVQYSKVNKIQDEEIINKETEIPQPDTSAKDIEKEVVEPETITNEKETVAEEAKETETVVEDQTKLEENKSTESAVSDETNVSGETNASGETKETTVEEDNNTSIVEDKSTDEKTELPENNKTPVEKMETDEPETLKETSEKEVSIKEEEKPVNELKESPEVQKEEDESVDETCTKTEEIHEVKETKETVEETKEDVKEVKEEMKETKEEVKEINEDVKELKEEVKEAKETKEEEKEIKEEVIETKKEDVKEAIIDAKETKQEEKEIQEEVIETKKETHEDAKEPEIPAEIEVTSEPPKEKESEQKQDVLVREDSTETKGSNEEMEESVEKTDTISENDEKTKTDTSEANKKNNKTTENKEEPSERPVRKRKWGKYKVSLRNEERITLSSIASFCPAVKMLNVDELKLERHESKDYEPKLPKRDRKDRDRDTVQMPSPPKNDDDTEKDVSNIGLNRKISIVNDEASKLQPPPSPANNPVSAILYITNLVRPFTLKQLQELLSRTGKIVENGFWTDKIKSKCYVEYETEEEAENTRNALHGVQWPTGNGKKLIIDFATQETMKAARNVNIEIPVVVKTTPDETPEKAAVDVKKETVSNDQRWDNQRTTAPIREWDLGKVPQDFRDRSRSKERDNRSERAEKRRSNRSASPSNGDQLTSRKKRKDEQTEVKLMDDLFHKTKATPSIYWLPLSPDQIAKKQQQRLQRMAEHKRRMEESRRFDRDRDFGRGGGQRARRRSARHDGD